MILDAQEQLLTGWPEYRVRLKVVDEGIGIHEDRRAGRDVLKRHGPSRMPNSGSRAIRSSSSALRVD
jgi:hypothetical protein